MAMNDEPSPPRAGAHTTRGTYGTRIRRRREKAGLSLINVMVEMRSRLPRSQWPSQEKLRRYESGAVPETRADPLLIVALADIFGCKVADLSPVASEAVQSMRDLLIRSCCSQYSALSATA